MARQAGRGSLFERLDPDAPPHCGLRRHVDVSERVRGIKRQLEALLNTRRGASPSSPSFGLPQFDTGAADLRTRMAGGIRDAITAHEPRLIVRDVRCLANSDTPLELTFRVDCAVTADHPDQLLEIDLLMNAHTQSYRVL